MRDDDAKHGDDGVPEASNEDRDETRYPEAHERDPRDSPAREAQQPGEKSETHRYLIGETLGEGGMAVVQLATDTQLKRPVAVKRLRPELADVEEVRQRFIDEAEILAGLDHPGTTPVFEAGSLPDGDCFYAMKRVSGRTLRELLSERTSPEILDRGVRAHFVEIFIRACQTVASAHDRGVIHRDLKPENIMVDDLGAVYVMDWGLAKRLVEEDADASDSQRTHLGVVMGTPAYMSPEQAAGHSADSDRQADVFSLGVMLYEILTGVNPFKGKTALDSMKGVMYHEPHPPRQRNSRIDRTVSAITMKALAKDPFRRYPSAHELAEDVRRYREYLPVSAIEPRLVDRVANWSRRRPRLVAIGATLAAVAVALMLGAALQASVENARVARAYQHIEEIETDLEQIETETATLIDRREQAQNPTGRNKIARRLAELEAEYEMKQKEELAIALAITGFTILSPEQRARRIVRESILNGIQEHVRVGDYFRARAGINFALRFSGEDNIFAFSDDEYQLLQMELAEIELKIEAAEALPEQ